MTERRSAFITRTALGCSVVTSCSFTDGNQERIIVDTTYLNMIKLAMALNRACLRRIWLRTGLDVGVERRGFIAAVRVEQCSDVTGLKHRRRGGVMQTTAGLTRLVEPRQTINNSRR
jgi:hypothetical protein